MGQPSDFGNIESRREEKNHLKKWWRRLNVFFFLTASATILMFGFMSDKAQKENVEINYLDFLVIDHNNLSDLSINAGRYYLVGAFLLLYIFALFGGKSKLEYEEELTFKIKKNPSLIFKIKYKAISIFDKVIYYVMLPFSYTTLGIDSDSKYLRNKFFMRYGWMSHLERTFFKQTFSLIDGYARSKELSDFKNFPLLFSDEKKIDKAIMSNEYRTLVKLFKSPEKLEDVFKITEGYMKNSAKKYDEYLNAGDFRRILKRDFNGAINDFRVYDGKDKVYFSFDLVKNIIDTETKRFMSFLDRYSTTSSGLDFTRTYKPFFEMLKKDKNTLNMLKKLHAPEPVSEDYELSKEELMYRVKFIFKIYFRFCATFYIINQYINLPAGTVVVRMDDYTLRMVIETYENQNIVSIEKNKNDGTTDSFKGDALVNMFLLGWNYYNYSVNNSFKVKVYNIFNLRDEIVDKRDETEVSLLSENMSKILKTPVGDNVMEIDEDKLEEAKKFLLS